MTAMTLPSPAVHLAVQQLLARIDDPEIPDDARIRPLHPEEVWPLWRAFSREGWCECRAVTEESVGRFAGWLVRHMAWGDHA